MSEDLLRHGHFLFISLPASPHTPSLPPSLIFFYPYLVFWDQILLCSCLASNFPSSCLRFLSAGITGTFGHSWSPFFHPFLSLPLLCLNMRCLHTQEQHVVHFVVKCVQNKPVFSPPLSQHTAITRPPASALCQVADWKVCCRYFWNGVFSVFIVEKMFCSNPKAQRRTSLF